MFDASRAIARKRSALAELIGIKIDAHVADFYEIILYKKTEPEAVQTPPKIQGFSGLIATVRLCGILLFVQI